MNAPANTSLNACYERVHECLSECFQILAVGVKAHAAPMVRIRAAGELAVAPVARLSPSQSWRFSSYNHQASFAGLERGLETQELCPQFFEYVTVCT